MITQHDPLAIASGNLAARHAALAIELEEALKCSGSKATDPDHATQVEDRPTMDTALRLLLWVFDASAIDERSWRPDRDVPLDRGAPQAQALPLYISPQE